MPTNRKIKICYVVAIDITIKLILQNYLKRLDKNKYDVWVVCSKGYFLKEITKLGVKVKIINISRKIFSPISDMISFLLLLVFLKKEKFDIVQLQTPKATFLGQIAARFSGIPFIINNNFGFYFHDFSRVKKAIFIYLERLAAKSSDLMFTINKEDVQTAVRERIFPAERIKYIGFGVDLERFNPEKFQKDFVVKKKKELGIDEKKKVVGIIARLVEEKGYLDLFSAFKIVIKNFPEALLLVVGIFEPEKKDAINMDIIEKYGIEKNVLFLGEREDIEELYSVMDIFVLPSHREGLGNTILEASAMRKPVIASNIRGCRESVEDKETGILVPKKNPEKLAEAILYLLENSEICAKFGASGRERIEKYFNENQVFEIINQEYKKCRFV